LRWTAYSDICAIARKPRKSRRANDGVGGFRDRCARRGGRSRIDLLVENVTPLQTVPHPLAALPPWLGTIAEAARLMIVAAIGTRSNAASERIECRHHF